ncbi:hypothetical protein HKD37_06G016550 [Glycine soja]
MIWCYIIFSVRKRRPISLICTKELSEHSELLWRSWGIKSLGQFVLGSGREIVFIFLVEELFHLRLGEWTLRVQQFGISFKLMLITCVGVSLQGQNTLTRHQWCHIDESDNVELPIVWQFVNYMDSWATFMGFGCSETM